ncbi:MAG: MerR family transcriptional regulator [Alistipes sp.]
MAEKLYYSMGEVTEMFDVNPSLIRYWGTQFDVLRPKRNKKGNRMFTAEDIATLKLIYHLVKERGMTIDGARKALKARRSDTAVPRDVELLERLQRLRAMLVQVREDLGGEIGEQVLDGDIAPEAEIRPIAADAEPQPTATEPVAKGAVESTRHTEEALSSQSVPTEKKTQRKPKAEPKEQAAEQKTAPKTDSKPQSTEARMDLPFYEQTLF